MNTICEVNVQRYPFDDQECLVELSTWGYAMNEVNLIVPNDPQLDTRLYVQSGEWIYVSFSVILNNITDDMNTYRTVQFKLKFERRWLFYSQYLLLPIMMNSVLMISVFLVPLDSGEKLGFSLTVLLSYVVLLTIVTDNLPPISTKTSVLQIYLSFLMILGTVTTLLSIWVLTLYNKDETQRIHFLLQKFADYVIAPITCLPCRKKNTVADLTSSDIKLQDTVVRNDDKENIMKNHERSQRIPSSTKNVLGAEQADRMSCREFAIVLDIFLFRVSAFSLFLLTLTITIFLVT
ncbi:5-hydroxytryptamine receptor 3A-like [Gigantopelta aegis]|uniref:5-hydroxytryptamine receptor 3A-like n=1 Tax=Gigantopelta aegis TaxID=1735272 RepID=UPI001B88BDC1|nr:5-hydroxytryptamine receptor 3A-like [Gigantopelta aegis]